MEFGDVLATLRNKANLSQKELAPLLGVSAGAVGMWESSKRQPNIEMIIKIARYFDVSIDYLLGYNYTVPIIKSELNEDEEYLLSTYRNLSKSNRIIALAEILKLSKEDFPTSDKIKNSKLSS